MTIQQIFSTGASGIAHSAAMLAASADNIANIGTARRTSDSAFQGSRADSSEIPGEGGVGGGVTTTISPEGSAAGVLVADPSNPLADARQMVRMPDIDLGQQMARMMQGQAGVAMNAAVVRRAAETYKSVLDILSDH